MKRALTIAVLAALIGAGACMAAPGPFIGTEITWGWPAISAGYDSGAIKGFVTKYEPLIVSGWWGLGFEGRWRFLDAWPNFKLGLGARTAILWEDWTPAHWYWGPTGSLVWDWGPYQFYIRGLVPIPVDENAPLFGVAFSIGADFNLAFLWDLVNGIKP